MRAAASFVLAAVVLASWAPSPARAQGAAPDDPNDGVRPDAFPWDRDLFDRLDADHDGVLRGAEVARARKVGAVFARYPVQQVLERFRAADRDGDGKLTPEETTVPDTVFERLDRDGDRLVTFEEALDVNVEELLAQMFAAQDEGLSGTLAPDEVTPQGRELFDVFDADGDGALSGEECFALLRQAGMAGYRAAMARAKKADATPGAPPAPAPAPARPEDAADPALAAILATFRARDADGDGALDRAEFPGSRELFTRSDIDGDGRVDEAEVRVRRERQRAIGARAEGLRARAAALGGALDPGAFAWFDLELGGLVGAGRLEEAERLLDEIAARLERARQG